MPPAALPTRRTLPLILVRGFGGLDVEDEKRVAYQGFNDGTVYPQKRGENFIYEGLILRLMKSNWKYHDATNVVGYYGQPVQDGPASLPQTLRGMDPGFFTGHKIAVDAGMANALLTGPEDPLKTIWVFRYYDLNDRTFALYGKMLVRLIDFIRALTEIKGHGRVPVNIIAHSMGGLIVREAIQCAYHARAQADPAAEPATACINKVVTLGTPHKGIAFQFLSRWIGIDAKEELQHFNPEYQSGEAKPKKKNAPYAPYTQFAEHFPLDRLLTVVGTNYRTYSVRSASALNRLFSVAGEYGPTYNRSDGLVKQSMAQIPGAPRTFVHKCHGGEDSLVTSREAFEVATRFFFGNLRARLRLVTAQVERGADWFGKSEFFFGMSIKPRAVDFDLFHQSAEAENCYGPFSKMDLSDPAPGFGWAGPDRLIWEGFLNTAAIFKSEGKPAPKDLVFRLDFYVGERDRFGIGFSDNVVFRKQYYVRAELDPLRLFIHTDERFMQPGAAGKQMTPTAKGWTFDVAGTGFNGTLALELDLIPEDGLPVAVLPGAVKSLLSS
jgi:hypothetical protein